MNLKSIKQSELSQKDKHKQCMLMHIHGIQKDGNDSLNSDSKRDTEAKKILLDYVGEGEGGMF